MIKQDFIKKLQDYLNAFSDFCIAKKINSEGIIIDHICYKCESKEEFETLRSYFEFDDKFVYQSIISKRRIAYVGFGTPLTSIFGNVCYLELSDQKPDGSQKATVDHIEPISVGISYEEMLKRFTLPSTEVEETTKPHHSTHDITYDCGIKIKMNHEQLIHKIYRDELITK